MEDIRFDQFIAGVEIYSVTQCKSTQTLCVSLLENKLKSFKKNVERISDRIINAVSDLGKNGNDVLNGKISEIVLSKQNDKIKENDSVINRFMNFVHS